MKIDLHIHTKTCSDGGLSVEDVFKEAKNREIELMSITDHDTVDCQERAITIAREYGISYITGIELSVEFRYPDRDEAISLDFLGYQYDICNEDLKRKLLLIRDHRERRALQILKRLNASFDEEGIERLTEEDLRKIQDSVDGVFGRPHIASYLVEKGIVRNSREAFDKYLVKCDVPKYPLSLAEASRLIRNAGGVLVHAHPNDPNGTSLAGVTHDLDEQTKIIEEYMLEYIDGVECWHSRNDAKTTAHYVDFATRRHLIMTGGSDCHQKPLLMGTVDIPDWVAGQFG
ncbi:MAG: PHP domain-containing protein [Chloroflexi bacterium]|nr:PHP domain-containing protein [Chloroflexota bacterium]